MDVLEALEELGIDEQHAAEIGIRLFKVSMPWPLEPDGVREFAAGLEEILVVEEKRQMVEYQLKEQLYNWRPDVRPRVIGKFDEKGEWVAAARRVAAARQGRFLHRADRARHRRAHRALSPERPDQGAPRLPRSEGSGAAQGGGHAGASAPTTAPAARTTRSTKVPEGSLALAGIGCHVMATAIYPEHNKHHHADGRRRRALDRAGAVLQARRTSSPTWATAPTSTPASWRSAPRVAAKVNITYKILYNDAVAMTGGQPVDGTISVPMIAQQMAAEGVERIALVTEDLVALRGSLAACRHRSRCTTARTWKRCSASCAKSRACRC